MNRMTCVIRNVAGIDQYIPIADAVILNPGERTFSGLFHMEVEKDGPSKSHSRTICLPHGELQIAKLTVAQVKSLGK